MVHGGCLKSSSPEEISRPPSICAKCCRQRSLACCGSSAGVPSIFKTMGSAFLPRLETLFPIRPKRFEFRHDGLCVLKVNVAHELVDIVASVLPDVLFQLSCCDLVLLPCRADLDSVHEQLVAL